MKYKKFHAQFHVFISAAAKVFFFFWDNYFMKYLSTSSLTERLQIKMIFLVVVVVFLFKTPACYTLSIT